ncbi:MAG: hypothetical protein U1E43_09855 [Rhodospirillales bacterium]
MAEFTVEDVAYELQRRRERDGVRCALLIGAGCSYQAGIPLAQGFVDRIAQDYPREYARAPEKTYPACMAQLARSDRHKLVCEYVDKAKINWAHISIAQLMRRGFIDRVLTTNFDPLVVRACALLNLYPAVYDMAVVRSGFVADYVRDLAVFHLHGQRDGFIQLHDTAQVDALRATIEPLFDDTANRRTWLVIGYSGQQDPVFEALADRPEFPNRLFWVGYRDEQPSAAVRAALIDSPKDANWIAGYDPDTFLLQLASKLDCFPPGFFAKPFSHLLECFQTLAGFRLPGSDQELDWAARARGWIEQAKATFEIAPPVPAPAAAAPPLPPAAPAPMAPPAPSGIVLETLRHLGKVCAPAPITRGLDNFATGAKAPTADETIHKEDTAKPAPPPAPADIVGEAWTAMMSGDYDKVIALAPEYDSGREPQLAEPLAWALSASARALAAKAAAAPAGEQQDLRRRAEDYAQKAEAIRPGLGAAALKP